MIRRDGLCKLPLKHISIRVPWHDGGWDGRICQNPKTNAACLVLDRIRDLRKDEEEEAAAGQSLGDLPPEKWPPCIDEHGTFMAPFVLDREITHPYSKTSPKTHGHLLHTPFRMPPYSAAAIPFRWMSKQHALEIVQEYELPYDENIEPDLGFETGWIQERRNQTMLLNTFFSAVRPEQSLCFFYAKNTPLVDDNRNVLIGVGRIRHVPDRPVEYNYKLNSEGKLRCVIWDRPLQHSIRPDYKDGFILPYHNLLAFAKENPSLSHLT